VCTYNQKLKLLILLVFGSVLSLMAAEGPPHVRGRLIAAPKAGVDPAVLSRTLQFHSAALQRRLSRLGVGVLDVPEQYSGAILESLRRTGLFRYVERDGYAQLAADPNDPKYPAQWHLPHIQSPDAWAVSTGAASVPIAVVDSGVDPGHPDLAPKLIPGWNFLEGSGDTSDQVGHGTAVAGTLAALSDNGIGIAGVSWRSPILPVAVVDLYERAAYSDIASGIQYATDRGARIINVSIGGEYQSQALQDAVDYAWANNALVFASAMNNATSTMYYPAACNHVVAVAATGYDDRLASFSNFGDWITLSAPGVNILTTSIGGGYGYWNGTSFASPIAAGVGALVLAVKPSMSNADLRQLLVQTSSHGLVNAAAAVHAARPAPAN